MKIDSRIQVRLAAREDIDALDRMYRRSYGRLLKAAYRPSVMVTAVPLLAKAQPALVLSNRFFVAEREGTILCAGGWSPYAPGSNRVARGLGHIRHLATDPDWVRKGLARRLLVSVLEQARFEGVSDVECLATRNAVPFYGRMGFRARDEIELELQPGIAFQAVPMTKVL